MQKMCRKNKDIQMHIKKLKKNKKIGKMVGQFQVLYHIT